MKIPDQSKTVVDGVAFVDLGGRAQARLIGREMERQKAERDRADPGAITPAEQAQLDAAEARLAEVTAAQAAAAATWTDLTVRRWQGQHETSLVNGVMQRVKRAIPSEEAVDSAAMALKSAEALLQSTLIWRNQERQKVDNARWFRSRKAEGLIK